ncbi:hypothetical protein [Methylobacterium organophilum]|uniref:Uncharacterized protein n=1 Tax=Methylobacterium organophilum TaxID=410 RepID=A0ABQ4T6M3_METOR|nr:hypothetical protein [Methylobacterium organophilum]GJE27330.1 hypothetical protein LKMONMHP_2188 [Methylobacterium organophilum]
MTTREPTLDAFRVLLIADPPSPLAAFDAALWSYLAPIEGLTAQMQALDVLERAVAGGLARGARASSLPLLLAALGRHRARLSEPSA